MKILLKFEVLESYMSSDYRGSILSFFKKSLSKCKEGKYLELFYGSNKTKDFTWSLNAKNIVFKKDIMEFDDNVFYVELSSSDERRQGMILMMAFLGQKGQFFKLPNDNAMRLVNVSQIKQHNICSNTGIFKTVKGSGLVVREHFKDTNKDRYYSCDDKDYNEKLMQVVRYQLESAGFSKREVNSLNITLIEGKKIVAKHYGIYIDVTIGSFRIEAEQKVIQYLYQVGVGSKRSIGFGMIDICHN